MGVGVADPTAFASLVSGLLHKKTTKKDASYDFQEAQDVDLMSITSSSPVETQATLIRRLAAQLTQLAVQEIRDA